MSKFEDQISRMKVLMTYGKIDESKDNGNNYSIEYKTLGADGTYYGIIRECSKFYIKSAPKGKENLSESYNYIGGWRNKKDYEYESYANALKQLELKLSSINEAHDSKINVETLDPFKKENLVIEGTNKMKDEIARQRQIMYNASMLMNESKDYAVKGNGCECTTQQPEAEKACKGGCAEKNKETKANPKFAGKKASVGDKKGPFTENPINEDCCDTDFDEGVSDSMGTKIGDSMPFDKRVNAPINEDDDTFAAGLGETGTGEADTKHNNTPFINEEDDDEDDYDVEEDGEEEIEDDENMNIDLGDEEVSDTEVDDIEDNGVENTNDNEDLMSQIEALRAQLEALESKVNGNITDNEDGEDEYELDGDFEDDEDMEDDDFEDDEDVEDDDFENDEDMEDDDFENDEDMEDDDFENGDDFSDLEDMSDDELDSMDDEDEEPIMESKKRRMNEDELHAFGKHPAYRKQPMNFGNVGSDRNEHGRDWNDDSTHGSQPYGEKIGSSYPFEDMVKKVTKEVMYQLKSSDAFKKKVN